MSENGIDRTIPTIDGFKNLGITIRPCLKDQLKPDVNIYMHVNNKEKALMLWNLNAYSGKCERYSCQLSPMPPYTNGACAAISCYMRGCPGQTEIQLSVGVKELQKGDKLTIIDFSGGDGVQSFDKITVEMINPNNPHDTQLVKLDERENIRGSYIELLYWAW